MTTEGQNVGMDLELHDSSSKEKKPRKRMKAIRKKIKEQMEFYFSDSNLHRDRFLKKEIDKSSDGYVDLSIFLKFNKVRTLTDNIKVVAKALSKSNLIQVNEDGSMIRRTKALEDPKNLDERTVYVECLPRNVDHDWIRKIFAECGDMTYISLPRYHSTGDLKGFAFIEFGTEDAACRACETLNNPPPDSGERIGKFPKSNKNLNQLKKKTGIQDVPEDLEETDKSVKESTEDLIHKPCKKHKKRRRHNSESSLDGTVEGIPSKKRKTESTEVKEVPDGKKETIKEQGKSEVSKEQGKKEFDDSVSDGLKSEEDEKKDGRKKRKRKRQQLSDTSRSQDDDSEVTDSSLLEKELERGKRKRSSDLELSAPQAKTVKSEKSRSEVKEGTLDTEHNVKETKPSKKKRKRKTKHKEKDIPLPQLRVIPKKDWLKLRKEYLTLQKASMAFLKKSLKQQQLEDPKGKHEAGATVMTDEPSDKKRAPIEFTAGVIVHVQSETPMNRKQLKEVLHSDIQVAYIDMQDEAVDGFIRCKDEASAQKTVGQNLKTYTFSLLTGDDEKAYWDKLSADREAKLNSKRKKNKRGSKKLIDKAYKHNTEVFERKHIVFED